MPAMEELSRSVRGSLRRCAPTWARECGASNDESGRTVLATVTGYQWTSASAFNSDDCIFWCNRCGNIGGIRARRDGLIVSILGLAASRNQHDHHHAFAPVSLSRFLVDLARSRLSDVAVRKSNPGLPHIRLCKGSNDAVVKRASIHFC